MSGLIHLYTHPSCLSHEPGPGHPESPERLAAVLDGIRALNEPRIIEIAAPRASVAALRSVHDAALVERLHMRAPAHGFFAVDADTRMSAGSLVAALHAAGAGVAAVDAVLRGDCARAFCAVRPPGHHATPSQAMGFCFFNSIAIAARHALDHHHLSRIAVLDFDVHHGNGTQDAFWAEPRVMFCSSHQSPLYPGTGSATEHGDFSTIHNIGLPPGAGSIEFRESWRELLPHIDTFAPQLILISAGFDAHHLDPLAGLNVRTDDYGWLTTAIVEVAHRHCAGRIVSMLEGGYSLTALRESSAAHVRSML